MKISVVIPTYRRPDSLRRCLAALRQQSRPADQIIVIVREADEPSQAVTRESQRQPPIQLCEIDHPGVIQALNLGMASVTGDIAVITDDDTVAPPDWLQSIERHYLADERLGGLGGRDVVHANDTIVPPTASLVGRILLFGRIVGNHHIGLGPPRVVDHLKGANMSWRVRAINGLRFDTELRGAGAQVYFELAFSLKVANRGWLLLYDPAVWVDHYPAMRFDSDKRGQPPLEAMANATFNLYYSLMQFLQPAWKRQAALTWARLLGTRDQPGILRGLLSRLRGDAWGVTLRGVTAQAWRDAKQEVRAAESLTSASKADSRKE